MDNSPADNDAGNGTDLLFNQSLEKGLNVLRAFSAKRRTMTLAEVAEAASMSKARRSAWSTRWRSWAISANIR